MGQFSFLKSQGIPQPGGYGLSAPRVAQAFGYGMAPQLSQRDQYEASAPMMGGDYGAPQMGHQMAQAAPSFPMTNGGSGVSAPLAGMSFDRLQGMAGRGQITRGPSPGFVAMDAARTAQGPFGAPTLSSQLPQFGENAVDVQNRRDMRSMTMDANQRANQYNMAETGLMGAQAGGINTTAPAMAGLYNAQAQGIATTAPAEAELMRGQGAQAAGMPSDWKVREVGYQRQIAELQRRHDALATKLATIQNPIHGNPPKTPQLTAGETDRIADLEKTGMSHDDAEAHIMRMRGQGVFGGTQEGGTNSTADMRSVGGAANTPVQDTTTDDGRDRVPQAGAAPAGPSASAGKSLDPYTAQQFLNQAGGDKNKARELAKSHGYSF
jgi:hypothetical protein